MKLLLKTEIEVNDKDTLRCAHACQHCRKVSGLYTCLLNDEIVDTGEDDDIGYGFKRTKQCLERATIWPPTEQNYNARCDFEKGAEWSRQFTVAEVLEFMRSDESIKKDDDFFDRNDCMMDRTLWVMEIEQHFSGDNKNENNRS